MDRIKDLCRRMVCHNFKGMDESKDTKNAQSLSGQVNQATQDKSADETCFRPCVFMNYGHKAKPMSISERAEVFTRFPNKETVSMQDNLFWERGPLSRDAFLEMCESVLSSYDEDTVRNVSAPFEALDLIYLDTKADAEIKEFTQLIESNAYFFHVFESEDERNQAIFANFEELQDDVVSPSTLDA